jgi:hypothetical protein
MLDWIKREPTSFREFADKLVVVLMIYAAANGVEPATASAITVAIGAFLTWMTRAVTVPTVKLTDAAIDKAKSMTPADIAKVEAAKAEAKP